MNKPLNKPYDMVVFIGRFQVVHKAHKAIIDRACELANHKVLVIVGSADKPRTYKNPFTTSERKEMIKSVTKDSIVPVFIDHIHDHTYNDTAWAAQVQRVVSEHASRPWVDKGMRIAIIGHKKDKTSFYLDMFPQWDFIDQDLIEPLDATQIRDLYFNRKMNMNYIRGVVPESIVEFLEEFRVAKKEAYEQVIREKEFLIKCKKPYEHLPYGIIFQTVDAVIFQSGHVLMIERKSEPGKGLWAFPGGYLNVDDRSLLDGMLRELREETRLKVPEKVLIGSITRQKRYDAINRSERGRIITEAFRIHLDNSQPLPSVKAKSDAKKAKWIPISEVKREECFEDHYEILMDMIGETK